MVWDCIIKWWMLCGVDIKHKSFNLLFSATITNLCRHSKCGYIAPLFIWPIVGRRFEIWFLGKLLCSGGCFRAVALSKAGLGSVWCWEGPCTCLDTPRLAGMNLDMPCKYLKSVRSCGRYFPQFPGTVVWSLKSTLLVNYCMTVTLVDPENERTPSDASTAAKWE